MRFLRMRDTLSLKSDALVFLFYPVAVQVFLCWLIRKIYNVLISRILDEIVYTEKF